MAGTLVVSNIETQNIKYDSDTTGMTINTAGVVTQPTKPMFRVVRSADQAIANNTTTVIQYNDKTGTSCFDIGGYFNTGTYRYLPLVAGYYSFSMGVLLEHASYLFAIIQKNGTAEFMNRAYTAGGIFSTGQVNGILYLDGVDDYVDCTVYHNQGGSQNIRGADADRSATYFCGHLVG